MNQLLELKRLGQSVWHDNLRKGVVATGELSRLIDEYAVSGASMSLAAMARAMTGAKEYDGDISPLLDEGLDDETTAFRLIVRDSRHAADAFAPLWKASGGSDGFAAAGPVLKEGMGAASIAGEARRLARAVDRPNFLVMVPATDEGLEAIEELVADGTGVHAVAICSAGRYEACAAAFMKGLEKRASEGLPIDNVVCSAAFSVSRADTVFDRVIEERVEKAKSNDEKARGRALFGKAAVANARLAYLKYEEVRSSARFKKLKTSGAKPLMHVWESVGVRNHLYGELKYAEELIFPGTASVMALHTLLAFNSHGRPSIHPAPVFEAARKVFEEMSGLGIDCAAVTSRIEAGCVQALLASGASVVEAVGERRGALSENEGPSSVFSLGKLSSAAADALDTVMGDDFLRKLAAKDPALWKAGLGDKKQIRGSLGWTVLPYLMEEHVGEMDGFASEVREAGFTGAVLLGMGGSSLAPLVFASVFGRAEGSLALTVLDSTDPEALKSVTDRIDAGKTLFIVSSKSGSTIEPLSLFEHFHAIVAAVKGEKAGGSFIAITDPGTPLEGFARKYRFRKVFLNPKDVGGRFSALSYFGLLPAAIIGVDIKRLLEHAFRVDSLLNPASSSAENPVMKLGAALGGLGLAGRDKLTFFLPKEIESFGMWIEQLVAESTGKEGKGLVPVSGEPLLCAASYGADRVFVSTTLGEEKDAGRESLLDALAEAGHPVIRMSLRDKYELGGEFLRWEAATAIAGQILGINPFDQPDVELAKKLAVTRLGQLGEEGAPAAAPGVEFRGDGFRLLVGKAALEKMNYAGQDAKEALRAFLKLAGKGDYMGLLAYYDPFDGGLAASFARMRKALPGASGAATQFGYGPRYLHSTGQLHKGRPSCGVFMILCHETQADMNVPGSAFTFSQLELSQAFGDMEALDSKGSRAAMVVMDDPSEEALKRFEEALLDAAHS